MKKISPSMIWRSAAFSLVAIAIFVVGSLVPAHSTGVARASHRVTLPVGARELDAGANREKASVGNGGLGNPSGGDAQAHQIRAFPATNIPSGGYSNATYQYNLVNDYTFPAGWLERGPNRTPNSNFFAFPLYPVHRTSVSGRATAFVVDPATCSSSNCTTQYLGTANGGVWKSVDGGSNWVRLFDHNLQTSIGGITLDPTNHNIIYVGTGEGNNSADSNRGIGIYRSTNGGTSWTLLGGTDNTDVFAPPPGGCPFGYRLDPNTGLCHIANVFVNRSVTRIVVDPRTAGSTNATLYAATTTGTSGCTFTYDTCAYAPGRPPLGFYYSTDGGQTWTQSNPPDVASTFGSGGQRANDLLMDPSNPNVLYITYAFLGIYRSTDDGLTWTRLAAQPGQGTFYRVTIDFAQSTANQTPQVMYAAYDESANTQTGIPGCNLLTSPHCGVGGPEQIYQIQINDPTAPGGAATFSAVPNPSACGNSPGSQCWYDMPLRIDPTNPNILYAGGSANYGFYFGYDPSCFTLYPLGQNCNATLMKSTDGGQTWRDISLDASNVSIHPDDHFIFINPADPSTVFTENDGGNFRATGANGDNTSPAGVVAAWNDENWTIGSFQFQGIGVSPNRSVIGGTQDNGTFITPAGSTVGQHVLLGDGGQGVADPFNSSRTYSEQYGATMYRFNNPTCDFSLNPNDYNGNFGDCGQTWIAPFAGDFFTQGGGGFYEPQTTAVKTPTGAQASNNIFHGTYRLWRSQDYGGVDVNGDGDATNDSAEQLANPSYWVPISNDLSCATTTSNNPFCGDIISVNVAPNDPNTVTVSTSNGKLFVTHNALAPVVTTQGTNYCPPTTFDPNTGDYDATCTYVSGVTWTRIDHHGVSTGLPNRVPTEVAYAPGAGGSQHFYVVLSGFGVNTGCSPLNTRACDHVFETTNGGATWTDINGSGTQFSLPDMPFNSIQVNQNNGHLYTAADIGVFESLNNGAQWERIDYALPNAPVYQLRLDPGSTQLFAATHGRGIWQTGAP